jgi:hypothetical protein
MPTPLENLQPSTKSLRESPNQLLFAPRFFRFFAGSV